MRKTLENVVIAWTLMENMKIHNLTRVEVDAHPTKCYSMKYVTFIRTENHFFGIENLLNARNWALELSFESKFYE